ncbi:signal peptide peptidase SppA [Candidatus Dojkabacteria bacterium]|nr:signal peptide peptidase SppA [Candidatus Dojkabacteria bacterium]
MSKKGCLIAVVVVVIIIIILLACSGICVLFSSVFSQTDWTTSESINSETLVSGGSDKIVVIEIEGMIMDVESETDLWGSSYASSRTISQYIDGAMGDDTVKAIILSMDTPGGDVYASDIIYNKIQEARSKGIKVVTLMRGTAASGGYYIAAASDEIVANPLTITGSIGVLMEVQSLDGLYEKLGIENRVITNSGADYKTGEGLFDEDPYGEEDQIYQEIIDEVFDKFVTVVAEGRNMKKETVLDIADGRVFTGLQAKEVKLVDKLGGFEDAVQSAERLAGISDATVVLYKGYDFWSMFAGYISNVVNPTAVFSELVDFHPGPKLKYLYVE